VSAREGNFLSFSFPPQPTIRVQSTLFLSSFHTHTHTLSERSIFFSPPLSLPPLSRLFSHAPTKRGPWNFIGGVCVCARSRLFRASAARKHVAEAQVVEVFGAAWPGSNRERRDVGREDAGGTHWEQDEGSWRGSSANRIHPEEKGEEAKLKHHRHHHHHSGGGLVMPRQRGHRVVVEMVEAKTEAGGREKRKSSIRQFGWLHERMKS
jgi:hypothetical protein